MPQPTKRPDPLSAKLLNKNRGKESDRSMINFNPLWMPTKKAPTLTLRVNNISQGNPGKNPDRGTCDGDKENLPKKSVYVTQPFAVDRSEAEEKSAAKAISKESKEVNKKDNENDKRPVALFASSSVPPSATSSHQLDVVRSLSVLSLGPRVAAAQEDSLKRTWSLWHVDHGWWNTWIKKLADSCVGEFIKGAKLCSLLDDLKPPSQMTYGDDYFIFHQRIQPMWEHPCNAKGGRWIAVFDEKEAIGEEIDNLWRKIVAAVVGERLHSSDVLPFVLGVGVSVRNKVQTKIHVWTRFADNEHKEANLHVGQMMKAYLQNDGQHFLEDLKYEVHKDIRSWIDEARGRPERRASPIDRPKPIYTIPF